MPRQLQPRYTRKRGQQIFGFGYSTVRKHLMNLSTRVSTGHPWYNIFDQGQRGTGRLRPRLGVNGVWVRFALWHCHVLGDFPLFFPFVPLLIHLPCEIFTYPLLVVSLTNIFIWKYGAPMKLRLGGHTGGILHEKGRKIHEWRLGVVFSSFLTLPPSSTLFLA